MDEDRMYSMKLEKMREYLPFLQKMIMKLERSGEKSKDPQLAKIKSLHSILVDPEKKLKLEALEKCEDVLQKLYEKVEGTAFKAAGQSRDEQRESSASVFHESPSSIGFFRPKSNQSSHEFSQRSSGNRRSNDFNKSRSSRNGRVYERDERSRSPSSESNIAPWVRANNSRASRSPWINEQVSNDGFDQVPSPWIRRGDAFQKSHKSPFLVNNPFQDPRDLEDRVSGIHQQHVTDPFTRDRSPFQGATASFNDGSFPPRSHKHQNPFASSRPHDNRYANGKDSPFAASTQTHNSPSWSQNRPNERQRFDSSSRSRSWHGRKSGKRSNERGFGSKRFYHESRNKKGWQGENELGQFSSEKNWINESQQRDQRKRHSSPWETNTDQSSRDIESKPAQLSTNAFAKSPASPPSKFALDTPRSPDVMTPQSPEIMTPSSPDLMTPRSPDMLTPQSTDMMTPKSPDLITPKSPDVITPKSPDIMTPKSPDMTTPKSPTQSVTKKTIPSSDGPKLIPLERDEASNDDTIESPASPPPSGDNSVTPASPVKEEPKDNIRPLSLPLPIPILSEQDIVLSHNESKYAAGNVRNHGDGLLPTPVMSPVPLVPLVRHPATHQLQNAQFLSKNHFPKPPLMNYRPPPADIRNSPFSQFNSQEAFTKNAHRPTLAAPKRPSTYGEYRRLREEREKRFLQHQRSSRDDSQAIESNKASQEDIEEKSDEKNTESSVDAKPGTANTEAISRFKIPKKKRPSMEELTKPNRPIAKQPCGGFGKADSRRNSETDSNKESMRSPSPVGLSSSIMSNSESDSENELKIVIEPENEEVGSKTRENRVKVEGNEAEKKNNDSSLKKLSSRKEDNNSAQELLKGILKTLDADEADSLMKKVDALGNVEELSLKQLRYLLEDENEDENENEERNLPPQVRVKVETEGGEEFREVSNKTEDTKRQNQPSSVRSYELKKPLKTSPTVGFRRSKRLQNDAEDISIKCSKNSLDDDDDEEEDQLIIDEGSETGDEVTEKEDKVTRESLTPSAARKRGRGRATRNTKGPENNEDDEIEKSSFQRKEESVEDLKLKGRPMRKSKMGMKSKTWFPDRGDTGKKKKLSPTIQENKSLKTEIKTEPKEADVTVFLGSNEISTENDFATKQASFKPSESLKDRLEGLHTLFEKIRELEKTETEPSRTQNDDPMTSTNPQGSSNEKDRTNDLGPFIVTEEPYNYTSGINSIIDTLMKKVEKIPDENEDRLFRQESEANRFPLLGLVREWNYKGTTGRQNFDVSVQDDLQLDIYTQHKLSQNPSAPVSIKEPEAWEKQRSVEVAKHLFKCCSQSCFFSSDSPEDFMNHLNGNHDDEELKQFKFRCVYCNSVLITCEKLIFHIIALHGSSCYQCLHCYHRTGSQLALFVHQKIFHPELDSGFIKAMAFPCDISHPSQTSGMSCHDCKFDATSEDEFIAHLNAKHPLSNYTQIVCWHCGSAFQQVPMLLLHSILMHSSEPIRCGVRHIDLYETKMLELQQDAYMSDEDNFSEGEETSQSESNERDNDCMKIGIKFEDLYACCSDGCDFLAKDASEFREHLSICQSSTKRISVACKHCDKQFKHIPTLLEHLKCHGPQRIICSFCQSRFSQLISARNHLRSSHKISNTKFVPVDRNRTNLEQDEFIAVPRSSYLKLMHSNQISLPSPVKNYQSSTTSKDVFSPGDIDLIPRVSMLKYVIRCSLCDFATRVRNNLVKHLKLHKRLQNLQISSETHNVVPPLTPINPPTNAFCGKGGKMSSLTDDSDEERARRPLTDAELAEMPSLVPESVRFSCCEKDCSYITIDAVMLLYHLQALHPELESFNCPHCPSGTFVEHDDLEFHLRCHGELLFRCGYCTYHHWQKRTAEKHVAEEHPARKQFTRDVRLDTQLRASMKGEEGKEVKPAISSASGGTSESLNLEIVYTPYKCGLCESAFESEPNVLEHCSSVHNLDKRFKCSFCDFRVNEKEELNSHHKESHPTLPSVPVIVFYIDQANNEQCSTQSDEKHEPLWRRNMPGLKHIRGILYEDEEFQPATPKPFTTNHSLSYGSSTENSREATPKLRSIDDEADEIPTSCKECGIQKQTIKALKLHIKLAHLRIGRFGCLRCSFSANTVESIKTHFHIKHPELGDPEYEETKEDASRVFSTDFWKNEWSIPTLEERKSIVMSRRKEQNASSSKQMVAKKRPRSNEDYGKRVQSQVKMRRPVGKSRMSKQVDIGASSLDSTLEKQSVQELPGEGIKVEPPQIDPSTVAASSKNAKEHAPLAEISPFETTPTYKCVFCPKRSQSLERIKRHLNCDHSDKVINDDEGYRVLHRDQVVDILTLSLGTNVYDYVCFYCDDVVGSIHWLQDHFEKAHSNDTFKVKSLSQGKGISGYLECQICGHLTSGFERSKQKMHFHEEHPLETTINCSKYVSKSKSSTFAETQKPDLSRFNGLPMRCPQKDCTFETKSISAMNSHLRRHTMTFKCGHCGKTHRTSSQFHQHSAMMHGDKIPDQVKDPEADAELEALKGLLESDLMEANGQMLQDHKVQRPAKIGNTARKSTSASRQRRQPSTARKSTSRSGKLKATLEPFSFYRVDLPKVNLSAISTKMSVGGMEISLSAHKMANIINLNPKVVVKDCMNLEKKSSSL